GGWPARGERVVVAVSGGADSTALLLALEELLRAGRLAVEVTAAHLNHGLRGERGAGDARWVEETARALGFEVVTGRAEVGARARAAGRHSGLLPRARRRVPRRRDERGRALRARARAPTTPAAARILQPARRRGARARRRTPARRLRRARPPRVGTARRGARGNS